MLDLNEHYHKHLKHPTTQTVEISDDDTLHCKHCYDEFSTAKDLKAHEHEFHHVSFQEKTILEDAERYVKNNNKKQHLLKNGQESYFQHNSNFDICHKKKINSSSSVNTLHKNFFVNIFFLKIHHTFSMGFY